MSDIEYRAAFIKQIKENPYDSALRLIFADWLDENGEEDEAKEQRRRSTTEWQEADKWMHEFASQLGPHETDYFRHYHDIPQETPITYEDCIQIGYDYLEHGEYFTQIGTDEARSLMWEGNNTELFWKNWGIITGHLLKRKLQKWDYGSEDELGSPFSCSC